MKKSLLLFAIAMLALISCSKGDEPSPGPAGGASLYMAVRELTGVPASIYDLQGNTIYTCDKGESIQSLVAEGSDWYALITRAEGTYRVVKNGEKIYASDGKIWCFAVEHGAFYLVLEDDKGSVWACKGWESQQDKGSWYCQPLFEVNKDRLYNTFMVHDGSITMAIHGATAGISINGVDCPLSELDHGFNWVYGIDFYAGYWLITYEDFETRKNMYWWKNVNYECPQHFQPTASRIVNGHAFILGEKIISQGVGGLKGLPAVLIDGIETVLNNDHPGYRAVSLASHGVDTYILVNNSAGAPSLVYKNLQPISLPDVTTPYSVTPYGSDDYTGKSNLSMLGIKAIATVENDR